MKIEELLRYGKEKLEKQKVEDASIISRILMQYVLKIDRNKLIINKNDNVDINKENEYKEYIEEIIKGKPVQYITNNQEFMRLNFYVDENVLIPQPDTEILVEEVIKSSVDKSIKDNKIKTRIQNTIIVLLSIIIIVFIGTFIICFLGQRTNIIEYLFNPSVKAEKIKIDDYGEYNLAIINKNLWEGRDLPCDKYNKNCIGQLTSNLPLKGAELTGTESLDTIIYTFAKTEKEYNKSWYDKNYSKKGMIVVSIKSFIIIKNLEHMNFEFKDKTYIINKQDVINFYKGKNLELTDLTFDNIWGKDVINKLKDKDFLSSFPIEEIA